MITYQNIIDSLTTVVHSKEEAHVFFEVEGNYYLLYNDGALKCFSFCSWSDLGTGALLKELRPYLEPQSIVQDEFERPGTSLLQSYLGKELGKALGLINLSRLEEYSPELLQDKNFVNVISIYSSEEIKYSVFFKKWIFITKSQAFLFDEFQTVLFNETSVQFGTSNKDEAALKYYSMSTLIKHSVLFQNQPQELGVFHKGTVYISNTMYELRAGLLNHVNLFDGWIKFLDNGKKIEILLHYPFSESNKFNVEIQRSLLGSSEVNFSSEDLLTIFPFPKIKTESGPSTRICLTNSFTAIKTLIEHYLNKINTDLNVINLNSEESTSFDEIPESSSEFVPQDEAVINSFLD